MMRINSESLRRAWKQPFSRKVALASGVVVIGAASLAAFESRSGLLPAPDPAACCTSALTNGETMASPAIGADKDFFEVRASPPNVFFLMGTNRSMQEFAYDPALKQYLKDENGNEQKETGYLPEVAPMSGPTNGTKTGDLGYKDPKYGNFFGTGCDDKPLVDAMAWFDKDSPDPKKNGSIIYDPDPDLGTKANGSVGTAFFNPAHFYHVKGWRIAWSYNNEDYPSSIGADFRDTVNNGTLATHGDAALTCRQISNGSSDWANSNSAAYNQCISCLTRRGWWRGPYTDFSTDKKGLLGPPQYPETKQFPKEAQRKWIVSGRVLNLHPPKFVVARKVLKDIINEAQNVRMGVASFGGDRGWYDPPWILNDLGPSCSKSAPLIDEVALNRPELMKSVNKAAFGHNERAIGEALFGLGAYFSSEGPDKRWSTWFGTTGGNIGDTIGNKTPKYNNIPSNAPKGNGWPGSPNGGTYDDPYLKKEGDTYAAGDEWMKPAYGNLPGQRFELGGDNKAVCFPCQVNSVIVITDGAPMYDNSVPITKMMDLMVKAGIRHETPGKELVRFDPTDPLNNKNSGGINYCKDFLNDPNSAQELKEKCDYTDYNWPHGLAEGNKNFMDDVAFFLAHMDLRTGNKYQDGRSSQGSQTVRTYTIGYGDNSPMLQGIAKAGKGKFYRADSGPALRQAIQDALGDIKQQSTSFASANIAGVQSGGLQSSTFVPRFVPRRARPYEGHLFRFFYYNEFAQGCQLGKMVNGKLAFDLNEDGDCDDAFFLDKPAGYTGNPGEVPTLTSFDRSDIVRENDEGVWVQENSGTMNATTGQIIGGTPAQPFWDLADTLNYRKASTGCDFNKPLDANGGRCIFTLIDRNADGKFTAEDNPPVEFFAGTKDKPSPSLALLKNYILAGGDELICPKVFSRGAVGRVYDPGKAEDQTDCARLIIQFVRGADVFDYDGDLVRDEGRPCADELKDPAGDKDADSEDRQHKEGQRTCKLADIFHSTPVTVEPPVEPFVCSLGLSSQCASTLYEDFSYSVTSEPLCSSGGSAKPCYKATPMSPPRSLSLRNGVYENYLTDSVVSKRDRIALVGSNGGMLHAIHVGVANQKKEGTLGSIYDMGSGQELWAFIPPDLMPKLALMMFGHEYYVDGTAMVRDIWADGAPTGTKSSLGRNGIKEKDEFRTIAVIGERQGGQRYTALDVTDPYAMLNAAKEGVGSSLKPFRWMFPNACDKESLTMGQSWLNFAPKPAPIGPVRLKASPLSPASDQDRGWEERWVAVLNGGYSPDLSRGRGVYMVDAWTGEKVWSVEAQPGNGSGPYAEMINKMQPVVAAASLVDIGKGDGLQRDNDGFFDTMLVGDMGGQMWTFRFKTPGETDATGQVANWFGARSLEVQRNDSAVNGYQKSPFFHVASAVLQPDTGWLRAYVGTGDRQHLRSQPGTDCSADDLLACIRLKCDVKATFLGEVNGQKRTSTVEYKGGVLQSSVESWQNTLGSACAATSQLSLTELSYSCPTAAYGSSTFTSPTYTSTSTCSLNNGSWNCQRAPLNTVDQRDADLSAAELTLVSANRYFGFHAYGGTKRVFEDAAGAVAFDKLRVTDAANCTNDGVNCSLTDVTIPASAYTKMAKTNGVEQRYITASAFATLKRAGPTDPGWFIRYNNETTERTASGSTVLAGVVFWSSFAPFTVEGADICSLSSMNDKSFSWQADAITGLPDQAAGFRVGGANPGFIASREAPTTAPPAEPTPVIAMSASGAIRFQVALTSAGSAPATETLTTRKNTTPDISWMEVPRNLHECRHENSAACADEVAPSP